MFKRTKKKLSVLVVLAMVFTMLLGAVSPAAAASISPVTVGSIPTIVNTGYTSLASIRYAETASSAGTIMQGDIIEIVLPDDIYFEDAVTVVGDVVTVDVDDIDVTDTVYNGYYYTVSGTVVPVASATIKSGNTLELKFGSRTNLNTAISVLAYLNAYVDVKGAGDIVATVSSTNTALEDAELVVGRFGSGSVTVSRSTTTIPKISKYVSSEQSLGTTRIRLVENVKEAMAAGFDNKIVLTLPSGLTWDAALMNDETGNFNVKVDPSNARKLDVWLDTKTATKSTFTITPYINATRLAPTGEINVTVIGTKDNNSVNTDLILCEVIEYQVEARRQPNTTPKTVTAGREKQGLATLELNEAALGSLVPGGTVTLTLPAGVKWVSDSVVTAPARFGTPVLNEDKNVLRFTVGTAGTGVSQFKFAQAINIGPKVSGEIVVTVGGTAGAEGEVVLANVESVFTAAASSVVGLRFGMDDQSAGNIVITEAARGMIAKNDTGDMKIKLTVSGATFSKKPTVTVTEGNIGLASSVSLTDSDATVVITVNSRSTSASTITISDIMYDVDKKADDGEIKVTVYGSALVDDDVQSGLSTANKVRVTNARVGAATESVFTIGSMTFKQDGQTLTMDVAPLIKNGRTLLPLRYAAMAAGVSPDEIIWDSARKAVTLIRGDRVVQVVIDSTTMLINGAAITMDVAPEIIDGRTMLPIRWIATALRANVDYDATAKTVTVLPY